MSSLSVMIPNFNHAAFLPAVVESCLAGPGAADEVIVVDDVSTDDSRKVLSALAQQYPRLRVILRTTNGGPAAAQNDALATTTCDWVLLRAADDLCPPGSLAAFRRLATAFPDAGLITGDVVYFAADPVRGTREHLGRSPGPVTVEQANYLERFGGNIVHGAASFVRTDWLRSVGGQDPALRWHSDWQVLMALALARGFVYAPEVLGAMRLNPQSYNAAGTTDRDAQRAVLDHLLSSLEAEPDLLARFLAAGCLDFFGDPLRERIRQGDAARRARFATLLAAPPPEIVAARAATGLASVFRDFLRRHDAALRTHHGPLALYGAGGHTLQLLAVWRELELPPPALILETEPPPADRVRAGLPVRHYRELAHLPSPLVVLSSKSYEPLFAARLSRDLPHVPFLRIWGADER